MCSSDLHAGMVACVEGARMQQVAAVHQVGACVRALRRRSLEHVLLRVAGLGHMWMILRSWR